MPLGNGFFIERKNNKYHKIDEHATDALANPKLYGTQDIQHLHPVQDRDEVVITTLKNGFIRVRDWKGNIGWQFYGDKEQSLKLLKKYMKKYEVGDYASITFTDFKSCEEIKDLAKNFL